MLKKRIIVLLVAVIGIFAYRSITPPPIVEADVQPTVTTVAKKQQDNPSKIRQLHCLAQNIYHEARSESRIGQKAVALVTMNRKMHPDYPNTVCGVVYQARLNEHGEPILHKCQFSWFCDGKSNATRNKEKWNEAMEVATYVYENYGKIKDVTNGAIMYHATYVRPYWKKHYVKTVKIDTHIFYK
jgi:N-acetylmuramoyl-L-alanine amidase